MPKPKITPHQARIVKAKVEATLKNIPQREFSRAIYPDQTPKSAEVSVSRELNKANVQIALQNELAKQGITIETVVRPIKDALVAEKVHIVGNGEQAMAEIVPDHTTRIAAVKVASKWMGLENSAPEEAKGNTFIQINNNKAEQYAE